MDDDTDKTTFEPLAVAAARVALKVNEKQNVETEGETDGGSATGERERADRAYVDYRLRELAAFERRARGLKE